MLVFIAHKTRIRAFLNKLAKIRLLALADIGFAGEHPLEGQRQIGLTMTVFGPDQCVALAETEFEICDGAKVFNVDLQADPNGVKVFNADLQTITKKVSD